jgi:hypothetical protein
MPTPPTIPTTPKPKKAFFLPIALTILGISGAMTKIAPVLKTVVTVRRFALPSTSRV